MNNFEPRLFFLRALILLLVLALPPLAIWLGKIVGGLKGWKWIGAPAILYISAVYIFGTAGLTAVTLAVEYEWGDPTTNLIGNTLSLFGAVCFLYGFMAPDDTPNSHPNG